MLRLLRAFTLDRGLFVGLLIAVALAFPPFASKAAWHSSFATYVHAIILEAFPYLLLGALLAGLIEWILPAEFLPRLVRRLGPFGLPATILMSPLTPVCECGVLPIARSLLAKGLPLPHTIAYLLAAPILNPTVILTTWLAFQDWRYPVLRVLGAVLIALIVGTLVKRLGAPQVLLQSVMPAPVMPSFGRLTGIKDKLKRIAFSGNAVLKVQTTVPRQPLRWRIGVLSRQVLDHFLDMGCYFLVGVFLAAAMKTFLGSHLNFLGDGIIVGPITMMITAFVLSLCAEADAFVAASFTEFSLPAKLAFLIIGPMLDIKLFLMYRKVFRMRFIALLSITLFVLIEAYALILHTLGIQ